MRGHRIPLDCRQWTARATNHGRSLRASRHAGVLDAGLAQRLRGAVGFRNVAVHSYRAIDWQIVHTIVHRHPDDFGSFALEAMRHAQ